jgi:deoxyhypusine monooxygenase
MCRHEAAEALGALGDVGSLEILRRLRDSKEEVEVVRETCEIAVARIEWENSVEGRAEKLRPRYVDYTILLWTMLIEKRFCINRPSTTYGTN